MKKPFLRFEDGKVTLGGKDVLAQSVSLSISPSLEVERVYGDVNQSTLGPKIEKLNRVFSPKSGLKGTLSITFVINAEFFAKDSTVNNIDSLFHVSSGMSDQPINGNRVGRYLFDHMYLKSFSFSMSPFQVINATANYDIYGSIRKNASYRFQKSYIDPAHALKSFGEVKASGASMDTHNGSQFEVSSLEYNIVVERKIHNHIRASEHTSINTTANSVVPVRVSTETIEAEMTIEGNEIIKNLNPLGDGQSGGVADGLSDSSVTAYLYSLAGERIASFSCTGKVMSQSLSLGEGQYSKGSITIKQIIK